VCKTAEGQQRDDVTLVIDPTIGPEVLVRLAGKRDQVGPAAWRWPKAVMQLFRWSRAAVKYGTRVPASNISTVMTENRIRPQS
jgi:hypothetical protein